MSDAAEKTPKKSKGTAEAANAALEARLEALRGEIDEIMQALAAERADAAKAAEPVAEAAELVPDEILKQARQALKQIHKQAAGLEKTLGVQTRGNPLQALLIAFGLGFLVSLLIRR